MSLSLSVNRPTLAVLVLGTPIAVLLTIAGLSMMGDPGPSGEVGVTTRDGAIFFRVVPCGADERVRSVGVRIGTGRPGVEGETVWEIRSESGSPLREYQVGETPEGFVETVKMRSLRAEGEYVAVVSEASGGLELLTAFTPNSLEPSRWEVSTGHALTEDEFARVDPCHN